MGRCCGWRRNELCRLRDEVLNNPVCLGDKNKKMVRRRLDHFFCSYGGLLCANSNLHAFEFLGVCFKGDASDNVEGIDGVARSSSQSPSEVPLLHFGSGGISFYVQFTVKNPI